MEFIEVLWITTYAAVISIVTSKDHQFYTKWDSPPTLTDEQRLLARLMTDYDKNTRPVYNASHPVMVKLGITLNQIFDLDERNQVLTTHIWLDQEWKDEKMGWDPKEYNQLKKMRVPSHLIWKPDIVLYNSADDYTTGYMPALSMVSHDGSVFWPPIVKYRSTCTIDISYFPFDDQICSLKLGSWAYDGLQVDVLKRDQPIDLTNYVNNGEWELISVKVDRNVEYYGCCPEPYPDVTFTLHLRRRSLYYTYNVIIPCIMLSSLTLLAFWMPPEGGEKVALGLTVLLAFSVFMLLIAENMPATSFYIPLIGVYIIVAMGLTCVEVTFAVIVSYIYHQGGMDRKVPQWLRKLAYYLNKIVRTRANIDIHKRRSSSVKHKDFSNHTDSLQNAKTPLRSSFNSLKYNYKTETSTTNHLDFENIHFQCNATPVKQRKALMHSSNSSCSKSSGRKRCGTGPLHEIDNNNSHSDELIKKLDKMLTQHEELLNKLNEANQWYVNKEWHEISEVIDRFLFWFYLILTSIITIVILVLAPLAKSVNL